MTRDEAKQIVATELRCTRYLQPSKGKQYKCPFCGSGERTNGTGALTYYPDTNTFTCFSCRKSGDVFDLLQEVEGVDFKTALERGAQELGISIDTQQRTQKRPQQPRQQQEDGKPMETAKTAGNGKNEAAARQQAIAGGFEEYYRACRDRLKGSPEAVSYLTARGISTETAAAYNIGFDPAADPANAPGAMENEDKPYPEPRVIIPCTPDFYIARALNPAARFKAPNPKGSNTKLFNAAALYSGAEFVFVAEGWADALSFIELGLSAVSLNGKGNGHLLIEQLRKKPTTAKLIICHDNEKDPKGQADTLKKAEELRQSLHEMRVKAIVCNVAGDYHDINDALQKDKTALTTAALDAMDEAGKDSLTAFWEAIRGDAYKPCKTGLSFFDDLLGGGMIRQTLLLLLAAPAAGKTTLTQQLCEAMAANKKPVIYLNLEMSREQMLAKAISSRLSRQQDDKKRMRITALDVLQGYRWTPEQRQAIEDEIAAYRQEIFPYLEYNPDGISSNIESIRGYLESVGEQAHDNGLEAPAIVVDYLHLITTTGGKTDTQELIKQTVTMLKEYAVTFNTFCIGIVATNRTANSTGRITMESGRDSSNLEYTADVQLSLNYYALEQEDKESRPTTPEEIAEMLRQPWRQMIIRVLKSRFSTPGKTARVYFHTAGNTFYGEGDWMPADDMRIPFDEEPGQQEQDENVISLRKK